MKKDYDYIALGEINKMKNSIKKFVKDWFLTFIKTIPFIVGVFFIIMSLMTLLTELRFVEIYGGYGEYRDHEIVLKYDKTVMIFMLYLTVGITTLVYGVKELKEFLNQ